MRYILPVKNITGFKMFAGLNFVCKLVILNFGTNLLSTGTKDEVVLVLFDTILLKSH